MMLASFAGWLALISVGGAAVASAIYLFRLLSRTPKPSLPIASILIIAVTALITSLQFVFPEVLSALRRNREALFAGQWWRMVTPLFVQAHGWWQCCVNGVGAVIFCPLAERLYGKKLFALYFVSGMLGEIFAYAWGSNGAGSSLGIAGVIGGLLAFISLHRQEIPRLVHGLAMVGFAGAVALCFYQDNHGPPILFGVLLASLMTKPWPIKALQPTAAALGISDVAGNIT